MGGYQSSPETTANLDWADLVILDLSLFDKPNGKEKLVQQLRTANETTGFFYLINHGLSQQDIIRQFEMAESIFAQPLEDKRSLIVQPGRIGYKPAGSMELMAGVKDNVEIYDDPKYNAHHAEFKRPAPCVEAKQANEKFQSYIHNEIMRKLLVLSALSLGLYSSSQVDEEVLFQHQNYDKASDCHMRYMLHHPRTAEELAVIADRNDPNASTIPGHTDFGTLTFLFRQPVAGLQIRKAEDEWLWVKPLENSITVNVADCLSYMSGGHMKSSIHRVILPPEDQRHLKRLSVIYFTRPDDDMGLQAYAEAKKDTDAVQLPEGVRTVADWVEARYKKPFNYKTGKKEEA